MSKTSEWEMPCNGGGDCEYPDSDHLDRYWDSSTVKMVVYKKDIEDLKGKIDSYIAWLCYACSLIESHNISMSTELSVWWNDHKEEDRKRNEENERKLAEAKKKKEYDAYLASVRERLMVQLSQDEKAALGIKS